MIIKPNDKKIRSFTRKYWKQGRDVLAATTDPVIALIGNVPIEEVKARAANMMNTNLLRRYLISIWADTGSYFAREMNEKIMQRQSKEGEFWEEAYIRYMAQRVIAKAQNIARTQAGLFNSVIDLVIQEGHREGLSIDAITERLQYELGKKMKQVQNFEAQRIAVTEVNGAANKGSFDGAMSTGLGIKKGWLSSGRSNVRGTHRIYEGMGFVPMDYEYAWGLKHPGDPNGAAEEIINCHCTVVYSTSGL